MDDARVGQVCRALRRRHGWRQIDLARRARCHQSLVSRLERGQLATMAVGTARRIFEALGASLDAVPRWRGGELERLLDARHAALVETVARVVTRSGWVAVPELTYSEFGERGSIDLLALREEIRVAAVFEMKTDLPSIEETLRRHDAKVRLAPRLVKARFGWWPDRVGRFLVMPEEDRLRRLVGRHRTTVRARYAGTSRDVARWLRTPDASAPGGIWFLSSMSQARAIGLRGGARRVRVPSPRRETGN